MIWLFALVFIGWAAYVSSRSHFWATVLSRMLLILIVLWVALIGWVCTEKSIPLDYGLLLGVPLAVVAAAKALSWVFSASARGGAPSKSL